MVYSLLETYAKNLTSSFSAPDLTFHFIMINFSTVISSLWIIIFLILIKSDSLKKDR